MKHMKHTAALIIIFLVLAACGALLLWFSYSGVVPVATPSSSTGTPTVHPKLAEDLYPLYDQAGWNAVEAEQFIIGTTTYSGASITSIPTKGTADPGSIFTPFERHYDQKLKALGWTVANDLAAGGHVGGQTGYRKGNAVILVRFHILYHTVTDTAPSECPCDVTLSLFSTE
ncbi:MAG TPA: hypothetical protein VMV71_00785 [Candidatus Paceibacterota bacterium]|nr:hypothetical protein [Candidatus Paceibacterota bacterium]